MNDGKSQEPMETLIREFAKLPGIGRKTAERLAFHILAQPASEAMLLADAVKKVKESVKSCSICYNMADGPSCPICSSTSRDGAILCVVEQAKDLWSIAKSGSFRGLYHVLQGCICPLDGIGPEHLTIARLVDRVSRGGVKELIIATNPTAEGDATAYYLQKVLAGKNVRITRIARGIPAGSSLEYANRAILMDAIEGRKEL